MKLHGSVKLFMGGLLIAVSLFFSQPINYIGSMVSYYWELETILLSIKSVFLQMIYTLQIIPFSIGVCLIISGVYSFIKKES